MFQALLSPKLSVLLHNTTFRCTLEQRRLGDKLLKPVFGTEQLVIAA
jgi:hypothetical protein